MQDSFGRAVIVCVAGLGLLAFVIAAPASQSSTTTAEVQSVPSSSAADDAIANWPDVSQNAAKAMMVEYGQPAEVTDSMLIWNDNGPWKQTIVYRDGARHDFPTPHEDVLQQTISYRVPLDKFNDLARFNGSLTADRTSGLLSSRSDREDMNFLALNLANDIIKASKNADDARNSFAKTAQLAVNGKSSPATQGLLFQTTPATSADSD